MGGTNPYDGDNSHNIRFRQYDNSSDEVNVKVSLDGKYELFGRKHDFFINASASREKFEEQDKWSPNQTLSSLGLGIYNWNSGAIAQPNWNSTDQNVISYNRKFTPTIYQQAVSLGTRYNFNDDLHLLIGGRFSRVKYGYYVENFLDQSQSGKRERPTKSSFTPYADLTWDFADNHSWYVSYAQIFKPQNAKDIDGNFIDPVVGYNLETGIKSEFFGGNLNTSIALFETIQKNRAIDDPTNWDFSVAEGKVRSRGVDVEINGAISDTWNIFAGYTYNKSEYMNDRHYPLGAVEYFKGADAKKYIPKHLFKIYTTYDFILPQSQKLSLGTGVRYQSKTSGIYMPSNLTSGNPISYYVPEQKGYALWDAHISYKINDNFDVTFAVKNITDKKYYENTHNRTAGMNNYYGEARNFALTFNYTY